MRVRDGNNEIRAEIPLIVEIVARNALWVNPETFRRLPVWCPYTARGQRDYDKTWKKQYQNKNRSTGEISGKTEANVSASKVLVAALGVAPPKPRNWSVCHIWGYDDPAFTEAGSIVRDPRYYSCVANMIWLPTPLKGFTDSLPEVKAVLRTCAFYLFGWACEHPSVKAQATAIRAGEIPEYYPKNWPGPNQTNSPGGTAEFTNEIDGAIIRQKQ